MTGPRPAGTRTRPRTPATDTDRGSSTLGAILVIPVMILLTMLVLQFAMLWHGKHVAAAVAQTGVQGAAGYRSSAADGQAQAEGYLADVAPNLLRDATVTGPVERFSSGAGP